MFCHTDDNTYGFTDHEKMKETKCHIKILKLLQFIFKSWLQNKSHISDGLWKLLIWTCWPLVKPTHHHLIPVMWLCRSHRGHCSHLDWASPWTWIWIYGIWMNPRLRSSGAASALNQPVGVWHIIQQWESEFISVQRSTQHHVKEADNSHQTQVKAEQTWGRTENIWKFPITKNRYEEPKASVHSTSKASHSCRHYSGLKHPIIHPIINNNDKIKKLILFHLIL